MDSKISVIVSVYKTEPYLNKCVESIINQTYQNLEIILVDDGSPDHCPELCDMWMQQDTRIQVIHQKNRGVSVARNVGIRAASGDYIGFVDSDDYIATTMYERMLSAIEDNGAELCICGTRWINEDGNIHTGVLRSPIINEVFDRRQAFHKLFIEGYFYYVTGCNKLYKSKIFDEITFPENRIHEDEFTIHYILNRCSKIVSIKDELYFYLQHSNSITHTYSIKRLDGAWAFYDRYLFFKKAGYKDFSIDSLKNCYYCLLTCIKHCDVIQDKKEFDQIIRVLSKAYWKNLRVLKLLLAYYKKVFMENIARLKARCSLKIAFCKKNKKDGTIVLLATPVHGNLGDQAIVNAEYSILKIVFQGKKTVEIPNTIYIRFPQLVERYISSEDIIIIDGGGNLGTLWPNEDDKIRDIIERFQSHSIYVFPQTCYYDFSYDGNSRLEDNRKIYETAQDLTIMLRDRSSYDFMRKLFPDVRTCFLPDIALSLHPPIPRMRREGVLLCFRKDCERVIEEEEMEMLYDRLRNLGVSYTFTSTVIQQRVTALNRNKELMKKWKEFSAAELLITDRLHGMIFAVITETPCIAMDNKSKKVTGVYEWIRDIPFVRCVDNISAVCALIPEMLSMKQCKKMFSYPVDKLEMYLREKVD